jgi:hypothetical protein
VAHFEPEQWRTFAGIINIDFSDMTNSDIIIDFINIEGEKTFANNYTSTKWVIELLQGSIQFVSSGFEQYIRRPPIQISKQKLELSDREGIKFEKITF